MPFEPKRLAGLRDLRHWKQTDLAKVSGLSQTRISAVESGTAPKVEQLEALANALDCTTDFLLGRSYKDESLRVAASEMAFGVFVERLSTPGDQRARCRRVLGHIAAPVTAEGWTHLAEQIERAMGPTGGGSLQMVGRRA